jgi:mannose-6-phosphate isomerase-like protein (cupin superfamily)
MSYTEVQVINLENNSEYQPLLNGKPQTCGMRSGRVYLRPGEDCGQHSTEAHEEMLVFLSGKGTAIIGDQQHEEYPVGQGKVSYIPPYTAHNIRNTGVEPLVYIYCVAPANPNSEDHHDQQEHHH